MINNTQRTLFVLVVFFIFAMSACSVRAEPEPSSVPQESKVTAKLTEISEPVATEAPKIPLALEEQISPLINLLSEEGIEMTLVPQGTGKFLLIHTWGSRSEEVGTIWSGAEGYLFQLIDQDKRPLTLPLKQLRVSPQTHQMSIVGEDELVYFSYISQIFRWTQVREIPYLSKRVGRLVIQVDESWRDGGIRDVVINQDILPYQLDDPETGEMLTLDSGERLSLATEVAEVLAARAWEPSYSFSDLRQGKVYSIRDLNGEMLEVDPSNDLIFYWTLRALPEGSYSYPNVQSSAEYWWDVDAGTLRLSVSIDLEDPIASWGGNVDIFYRKALLTMLLGQYPYLEIEGTQVQWIPDDYPSYSQLLPDDTSRNLSQLIVALVHEIDEEKLQERQSNVGNLEIGLELGIDFDKDLFYTEK